MRGRLLLAAAVLTAAAPTAQAAWTEPTTLGAPVSLVRTPALSFATGGPVVSATFPPQSGAIHASGREVPVAGLVGAPVVDGAQYAALRQVRGRGGRCAGLALASGTVGEPPRGERLLSRCALAAGASLARAQAGTVVAAWAEPVGDSARVRVASGTGRARTVATGGVGIPAPGLPLATGLQVAAAPDGLVVIAYRRE